MVKLPLTANDMNRLPGSSWINIFCENAEKLNHEVLLSGDILAGDNINGYLLVSEMFTSYTDKLIQRGAIPFLVYSQESPNISKSFYKTYSTKYGYKHAYLFPGSFDFFGRLSKNIDLFWPNNTADVPENIIEKDIFIGMIASNKQIFNKRFSFIPTGVEQFIKAFIWKDYYKKLNNSGYKDIYEKRLKAIEYFSDHSDFSLYGRGWNQMNTLTKQLFEKVKKLNPQEIDDKMKTLSRMKFSICFENFNFPGYITEKIFDCFLTGSIPIYLGAPDIDKYVPAETFIDARKFGSFKEIDEYIRAMKPEEVSALQNAASQFLKSPDYVKFTDKAFADNILALLNDYSS